MQTSKPLYHRHRFPDAVISRAVRWYFRFQLSLRDIEELLFERGVVTYSNQAKVELLGVDPLLIGAHGAVSEPVVCAMAEGALVHSRADQAVAVTGIAGPGGAVPGKPVGTVWLAFSAFIFDLINAVTGQVLRRSLTVRGFIQDEFERELGPSFHREMGEWVADGRVRYQEDIVDGLERAKREGF